MIKGHPQICLYRPEIPQNAGSIGRLAAGTGCRLHLIKPFGFSMSDRNLRRPWLDYWPFLDLEIHDEIYSLIQQLNENVVFLSKHASKLYTDIPTSTDLLIFGQETSGLPQEFRDKFPDRFYKIPIFHDGVRSLNLANAVSIVVYDQLWRKGCF